MARTSRNGAPPVAAVDAGALDDLDLDDVSACLEILAPVRCT
jgi:hypothetical protein